MVIESLVAPIDASELLEALAVLRVWEGREDTLPLAVRAQVQRLVQACSPAELTEVLPGAEIAVVLKPEVRAIIATLRALEG